MICAVCGGTNIGGPAGPVLWPDLIEAWGLSSEEVRYVDRQQGAGCLRCGSNLRSIALAEAITRLLGIDAPLATLTRAYRAPVLEVNAAGSLHPYLAKIPGHVLVEWPEVDMRAMPFADEGFDLVLHSDTLEHVERPDEALRECRRVLRPGGACIFTIPIIVGRMTRSRRDLPPSYHGMPTLAPDLAQRQGLRVHTEFGADFWTMVLAAGFRECSIVAYEFPAALAVIARR